MLGVHKTIAATAESVGSRVALIARAGTAGNRLSASWINLGNRVLGPALEKELLIDKRVLIKTKESG